MVFLNTVDGKKRCFKRLWTLKVGLSVDGLKLMSLELVEFCWSQLFETCLHFHIKLANPWNPRIILEIIYSNWLVAWMNGRVVWDNGSWVFNLQTMQFEKELTSLPFHKSPSRKMYALVIPGHLSFKVLNGMYFSSIMENDFGRSIGRSSPFPRKQTFENSRDFEHMTIEFYIIILNS